MIAYPWKKNSEENYKRYTGKILHSMGESDHIVRKLREKGTVSLGLGYF